MKFDKLSLIKWLPTFWGNNVYNINNYSEDYRLFTHLKYKSRVSCLFLLTCFNWWLPRSLNQIWWAKLVVHTSSTTATLSNRKSVRWSVTDTAVEMCVNNDDTFQRAALLREHRQVCAHKGNAHWHEDRNGQTGMTFVAVISTELSTNGI